MQKAFFFHEAIFVDVNGCLDKRQTPPFAYWAERFRKKIYLISHFALADDDANLRQVVVKNFEL